MPFGKHTRGVAMSEGLSEKQRRIVKDIRDAYSRGEDAAKAMERISRLHVVDPEAMVGLLCSDELRPSTGKGGEPETVLMVGHKTSEGFRSFAIEGDDGVRELPVFTELAKAGKVIEELGYNPEMVRLKVPMESLGALEVPFEGAMCMAASMKCDYIGVDIDFGDVPYRRFPVSSGSR